MSEGSRICDIIGQFLSNGMMQCQQEAPTISYVIHLLEEHARRTK
jgi:hypothetical protein